LMVAPFGGGKQVLGAHVGTKDDLSTRKFQEVLISEFFGSPPQRKAAPNSKSHNNSPRLLLVDASAAAPVAPVAPPKGGVKKVKAHHHLLDKQSSQEQGECAQEVVWEPQDSIFLYLVAGIVAAVIVTSRLEKKKTQQ
jgi:hypothetical protein